MEKANVLMKEFYSNPQERALYLAEFRDACDRTTIYDSGVAEGERRGIELGEKRGAENERFGIAGNMKKNGMPIELIVKLTNLKKEEVEKI